MGKIKYAFTKSLPVMFGYVFLGTAFGILLREAGYGLGWALGMSTLVFAGSMQFVMVPMLVAGVSPLTMAVTTLLVNGRHMFYGLSFIESFKKIRQRPYLIFALSDETYSVLLGCRNEDPEETHRDSWFFICLFDQCYWVTGSLLGSILGKALPIDFTGIDFSMTALFIVILLEQILSGKKPALIVALMGFASGLLCLLLFGIGSFLLPALILTLLLISVYSVTGMRKEAV